MLKLFEVSGFKSFRETVRLDFSDVRDYQFNTDCLTDGLLSKILIYGKNAAGKSNLGLALFDIVSHLTGKNVSSGLYDYYLNASCPNDFAEFHYVFRFDGDLVDYRYRKNENQSLIYEKLSVNGDLLYEFDYRQGQGTMDGIRALAPTLNWSLLETGCILKYVIHNTLLPDDHPLRRMMRFVSHMLWFRSLGENRYIGYKTNSHDFYDFIFEGNALAEFEELLHTAGVEENLAGLQGVDGKKRLYLATDTPLPFLRTASSGTRCLYTFFYWYKTARDMSFLFIDEFDAFYHYELAKAILPILKKMTQTQIILTSHNTNLLTNRVLRPDCYFILSRDRLTSVANATGRELREGHNLEKLYLDGAFTST